MNKLDSTALGLEMDLLRARIAELEEGLQAQTVRADAATKELETFLQSLSHDLRAPLRAVMGFSRRLGETHDATLGDDGRRTLGVIRDETWRMSQLIEGLIAYSRAGRLGLEPASINMTELAESAFQNLREQAQTPAPILRVAELPAAHADRRLVREIFHHLLANAIKFTRQPGAEIKVTGMIEDGWSTYRISDNGVGFDQRYAHKLFGLFQRLHRPDDFEGIGVGLAVVQRIVHRHGGRVWVTGAVNAGADFYFTLSSAVEESR